MASIGEDSTNGVHQQLGDLKALLALVLSRRQGPRAASPVAGLLGTTEVKFVGDSVAQAFTITGGTGVFAGASGSGVVSRTNVTCCAAHGTDNWNGTIAAPAFKVDLTPPAINGAHNRLVHAPRGVKRVHGRYKITAQDDVDGALRPTCRPRSGSLFRVGRRTKVRCSVSDRSANFSRVTFSVRVRRAAS